ncbi:MAG TPA: hypothetical protein VK163_08595 [Opitutaceae bacterium]|nr:hypothetical protein [Opitutaceae bacterium]
MKKYTHAWIACKAIERLQRAQLTGTDRADADDLTRWFMAHRDGVIAGAWYPDEIIKDNASSHILKHSPVATGGAPLRKLPPKMKLRAFVERSPLRTQAFTTDRDTNLPARCEALAHSVIDSLRVQQAEPKGSPIAPTNNHVALRLFMLSHYVADAHMPLHCDSRRFSESPDIHALIEKAWEDEIEQHIDIDAANERFRYTPDGFPRTLGKPEYATSLLKRTEDELATRGFSFEWGTGNGSVLEYVEAVCQHAFLLSCSFLPLACAPTTITRQNWRSLPGQQPSFDEFSLIALSDAVDSVARVWLRVWRRYRKSG